MMMGMKRNNHWYAWRPVGYSGAAVGVAVLMFAAAMPAAERFAGGEIGKGELKANISDKGSLDSVSLGGVTLFKTNGGVSTGGSKDDQWKPWAPQTWAKDVKLEKEETPEAVTVTATGVIAPKEVQGSSTIKIVTKVTATAIVQHCEIKTTVKELWRSFGESFRVDADAFGTGNYRVDGGEWKLLPEAKGNRNLVWPTLAETLDMRSAKYSLTFKFDGVKTAFFDDRKPGSQIWNLEFGLPPREITDERGGQSYGAEFGVAIEVVPNKTAELPIKPPPAAPSSSVNLAEGKDRLVENTDFRRRYSLDGEWDFRPLGGEKDFPQDLYKYPIAAGKWAKISVPAAKGIDDAWPTVEHAAWYKIVFTAPADIKGKRVVLRFEEINYLSRFFLNGKEVGRHLGGFVPVSVDVTRGLVYGGENTLEVFVGDNTAVLDKAKYPDGAPKSADWSKTKFGSIAGLVFCAHKGIIQSVFLEASPVARVDDVFVKTLVRKGDITSDVEVANASWQPKKLTVKSVVLDGDKVAKELPEQIVDVPAAGAKTISTSTDWKDARLWFVKQPNLYVMKTDLYEDGKLVDSVRTRFGFREFWIEGTSFVLNGVKLTLRECATHIYYHPGRVDWDKQYAGKPKEGAKAEMEAIQWANFNCTRMVHRPHPAYFYDIADELGHLVISHFPVAFHKDQFDFMDQRLYDNAEQTIRGLVRKERNHPSIIMWEGENEGFPYGENELAFQFADFYDTWIGGVAKANDPTRIVKYGREGDLMGRAPVIDMHGGDRRDVSDEPLPNSNWRILEPQSYGYGVLNGTKWEWKKDKPLYYGEGLYWMMDVSSSASKGLGARFLGEKVFDDTQCGDQWFKGQEQLMLYGQAEYFKVGIPIWRMLGALGGYCPWGVNSGFGSTLTMRDMPIIKATRELMKSERFFLKQWHRNFFAGSKVSYDLCFINDDYASHEYKVEWTASLDGAKVAGDSLSLSIKPSETAWKGIAFAAPKVDVAKKLDLVVKMSRDGQVVHEETIPLRVYPTAKISVPGNAPLALFDPSGKTAAVLDSFGVKYVKVASLEDAVKGKERIIVIGEYALAEGLAIPLELDEFVRNGGRVLVLPQSIAKNYAPVVRADPEAAVTRERVFICDRSSPLLKGIFEEELSCWNHPEWDAAHSVAVKARQKFNRGNARAILDCDTQWFAALQEAYFGKGLYLECSMDIVRKAASEPLAAALWDTILARLAEYAPPTYKTLSVLRDEDAVKTLQAQGIVCANSDKVPADGILLITDASNLEAAEIEAVKKFAEAGGTVWRHARKGGDTTLVEGVTGAKINVKPYPNDWRERAVRRTEAGKTAGPLAGVGSVAIYDRNSVDDIWSAEGGGAVELATGGAAVDFPVGKGRLVVERFSWDKPVNMAHQQWADHVVSSFVTSLGGEIDLYRYSKRKTYKPDDFAPIDIAAVCNRGFRDDTAGDGKGGWTYQGPNNDLRGMRSGRQSYHQIVFEIVDPAKNNGNACLVLNSPDNAPSCPKSTAEIPVGMKAKALFLLHTAAWYGEKDANKPVIRYVVTYDDGSNETINTLGGLDIKDWWTPGNCGKALGVSLLLKSDTEADALPRKRGLQLQEWENPKPDKAIKSIRIESGDTNAIPIVMAITAYKS